MNFNQAHRLYQAAMQFHETGITQDPELRRATEEAYSKVKGTYLALTCATVFRVIAERFMRQPPIVSGAVLIDDPLYDPTKKRLPLDNTPHVVKLSPKRTHRDGPGPARGSACS